MSEQTYLHVDRFLTNVAIGYKADDFIAEEVFPSVPVNKQGDLVVKFGKESFRIEDDVRANGARSARVKSYSVGTTSYFCIDHSLNDVVTVKDRKNADAPIVPDREVTEGLVSKILRGHEKRVATAAFSTTNFSGYTSALTSTDRWDDLTNSDPIKNIEDAREAILKQIGRYPNRCVIGAEVWTHLKQHPDLLEKIKYVQRGQLTPELVASLFEVEKVIVGKSVENTAREGQSVTMGFLWGKYCLLYYTPPRPALKVPATGYTYRWRIHGGKTAVVQKWNDPAVSGDVIEASIADVTNVTSAESGYLYSTVVS